MCGLDTADYLVRKHDACFLSLIPNANLTFCRLSQTLQRSWVTSPGEEQLKNSEGRSGSLFYKTPDGRVSALCLNTCACHHVTRLIDSTLLLSVFLQNNFACGGASDEDNDSEVL
jgi:hypothetical protein